MFRIFQISLAFFCVFFANAQNPSFASEFFPSSPGLLLPPVPGDEQKAKKTPTEEELIGKLLKSGAGLPPGPPADLPSDGEEKAKTADGTAEGQPQQPQQQQQGQQQQQQTETEQPIQPMPPAVVAESPSMPPQGTDGGAPAAPPNYVQCLLKIAPKVCDPGNILNAQQKQEIDQTLAELKMATRKEDAKDECAKSGLEAMFIIIKHSNLLDEQTSEVQRTLNQAMDFWVRDHPCEKPVVIMLSTDPSIYNRKVWTGRHWDVPVDPGQLVQLFMDQVESTRQQKYALVIMNMIEGLLERYENSIGK
ncbi:hypothetical protein niasHT_015650 [Heterodera trifolii]|uniref:TPM domain-containing protein n=1 Tax=Heterodera trifolii TaxID=157864 RepID=A0ABD2L491_9BILA